MYVILGIGNPGKKYEGTRHNIGFIALDYMGAHYGIKINKIKHKALIGEGNIAGEKVILVKPQTYVNLSGESLREVCTFYKVPPENVIVIHDDVSLDNGIIRIREKGSAGGHNGLKSIILRLNSDEFPRIKIGVGAKKENTDLADHVLGRFQKSEVPVLEDSIIRASEALELMVKGRNDLAMSKYNSKNNG